MADSALLPRFIAMGEIFDQFTEEEQQISTSRSAASSRSCTAAARAEAAADRVDVSTPNVARMYDYYLLRHEALRYRVGVETLAVRPSQRSD